MKTGEIKILTIKKNIIINYYNLNENYGIPRLINLKNKKDWELIEQICKKQINYITKTDSYNINKQDLTQDLLLEVITRLKSSDFMAIKFIKNRAIRFYNKEKEKIEKKQNIGFDNFDFEKTEASIEKEKIELINYFKNKKYSIEKIEILEKFIDGKKIKDINKNKRVVNRLIKQMSSDYINDIF